MKTNAPAPEGQTWLCGACGHTAKNPYDFFDACFMNLVLVTEASIERDEKGRVIAAEAAYYARFVDVAGALP